MNENKYIILGKVWDNFRAMDENPHETNNYKFEDIVEVDELRDACIKIFSQMTERMTANSGMTFEVFNVWGVRMEYFRKYGDKDTFLWCDCLHGGHSSPTSCYTNFHKISVQRP